MIDTHTHIYLSDFAEEHPTAVADRALEAGVELMILPNIDVGSITPLLRLRELRPEITRAAMGLHPTELGDDFRANLREIERELDCGEYIAIGEVGIDLYWDKSRLSDQKEAFCTQLRWAKECNLPVIIHSRDAFPETVECLEAEKMQEHPVVFHSFTGNEEDFSFLHRHIPGAYFGINGVVTYKSARGLRSTLPLIPADRLLLETDSPYLAPVPHRGKRNESSYLPEVCRMVASVLGRSEAETEALTSANARRLFRLDPPPAANLT